MDKRPFILLVMVVVGGCTLDKIRCRTDNNCPQGMVCGEGSYCVEPEDTSVKTCWTGDTVSVTAGLYHTCAVLKNGRVKCWGNSDRGQTGNGGVSEFLPEPAYVISLESEVLSVSAGLRHTCALLKNGGVKCWGDNEYGQLGDNTTTTHIEPVSVSNLNAAVKQISSGASHNCVLLENGGVKCWGRNDVGQIGDGSTIHQPLPVDVSGLKEGVEMISAGYYHTCALLKNGSVRCWGDNYYGQLGDNTTISRNEPVSVSNLTFGVRQISSGGSHNCVLTENNGVKCWGRNDTGQIGDGSTTNQPLPVDVSGLNAGVGTVIAGGYHTCALMLAGSVKCWGDNENGQIGIGSTKEARKPNDVFGLESGVKNVCAGEKHNCALLSQGGIMCWGWNAYGQIGDGTGLQRTKPVNVLCNE